MLLTKNAVFKIVNYNDFMQIRTTISVYCGSLTKKAKKVALIFLFQF